ncbi:MAG: hypothetical protein ACTSPY_08400 [Candidatus Helarchaeota archaeon]
MPENISKDISEIIKILKSIRNEIKKRFNEIKDEVSEEFKLDIIKSAINYSLDKALLDVNEVIYSELEKLNWIDIIIDCGEIDNELEEIQQTILLAKENISEELKDLQDFIDFKININEITRKIHLQFPISWGLEKIDSLFKNLYIKLKEKEIIAT